MYFPTDCEAVTKHKGEMRNHGRGIVVEAFSEYQKHCAPFVQNILVGFHHPTKPNLKMDKLQASEVLQFGRGFGMILV